MFRVFNFCRATPAMIIFNIKLLPNYGMAHHVFRRSWGQLEYLKRFCLHGHNDEYYLKPPVYPQIIKPSHRN